MPQTTQESLFREDGTNADGILIQKLSDPATQCAGVVCLRRFNISQRFVYRGPTALSSALGGLTEGMRLVPDEDSSFVLHKLKNQERNCYGI